MKFTIALICSMLLLGCQKTEVIEAPACPSLEHLSRDGVCRCNIGYARINEICQPIECPENAVLNGNLCDCTEPFFWNEGETKCRRLVCPPNASIDPNDFDEPECECDPGFIKLENGTCHLETKFERDTNPIFNQLELDSSDNPELLEATTETKASSERVRNDTAMDVAWNYFEGLMSEDFKLTFEQLSDELKTKEGSIQQFILSGDDLTPIRDVWIRHLEEESTKTEEYYLVKFESKGLIQRWKLTIMKFKNGLKISKIEIIEENKEL